MGRCNYLNFRLGLIPSALISKNIVVQFYPWFKSYLLPINLMKLHLNCGWKTAKITNIKIIYFRLKLVIIHYLKNKCK